MQKSAKVVHLAEAKWHLRHLAKSMLITYQLSLITRVGYVCRLFACEVRLIESLRRVISPITADSFFAQSKPISSTTSSRAEIKNNRIKRRKSQE